MLQSCRLVVWGTDMGCVADRKQVCRDEGVYADLRAALESALASADSLSLSITGIHIAQALDSLPKTSSADVACA